MFQATNATTRDSFNLSKKGNQDIVKQHSPIIPSENVSELLVLNTVSEINLQVDVVSPNQHSGNQSKEYRIILVSSFPNFEQGTVKTHLNNQMKQKYMYSIFNSIFPKSTMKNQNRSSCYFSSVFVVNFGQAPSTSESYQNRISNK